VGAFALRPPHTRNFRLVIRRAYSAAIAMLLVFLIGAVILDWPGVGIAQRTVYGSLVGLGAFIAVRVFLAIRLTQRRPEG